MKAFKALAGLVLLAAIAMGVSCSTPKQARQDAKTDQTDSLLIGKWMESHEERKDNLMTWRNVQYFKFPPARGRTGFVFLPEGKMIYLAIAPTDGTEEQPGRFGWGGKNELKITLENGRLITLHVQEFTKEKLVATWNE